MIIKRHNRIKPQEIFVDETIFTTQNRYLGVRGCFEEGHHKHDQTIRGTYINGIYDTHQIPYEEKAYGFPEHGESIVNIADAQGIFVQVNNIILSPAQCEIIHLERTYHLDEGYTTRHIIYQTPEGYQFSLTYKRIASLAYKELFMIDAKIKSINYDGPIKIISTLDGDIRNYSSIEDPRMSSSKEKRISVSSIITDSNFGLMTSKTKYTDFEIFTLMTHNQSFKYHSVDQSIIAEKNYEMKPNKTISFKKYALYFNDLDYQEPKKAVFELYQKLNHIDVYQSHLNELKAFWDFAYIDFIDLNHPDISDAINYNLYQLFTSGGDSERVNIPAKGLSGEGYEGHAFWDSEIYMLPFFMQVNPKIAKSLLTNRYQQMDLAREEARLVGVDRGIKFAWRTISGKETSAYFPAGQAQYHINSDIAYAFIKNYQLHKDQVYFIQYGLPVLIETARFFKEIAFKNNHHYHINGVTGPDEYTTLVNDNYYTNSLVKFQLEYLISFLKTYPNESEIIVQSLQLTDQEIEAFIDIAKHLYLPYDESFGIDLQDDGFLMRKPWDFEKTKSTDYPLLLHYHPLKIYRHQVLKQPDTVLSHYLLNNRPESIMKRSYDYYEALTTHDSSLSRCIHAVQAARLGESEKAYQYFLDTIWMDLSNIQKNTEYGLHVANLGGIYNTILYGFMGLDINEDIHLNPHLPKNIEKIEMNLRLKETCVMNIKIFEGEMVISVSEPIELYIYDEYIKIKDKIKKTMNDN
jgi:alpha,alpha-trehalose phosphorylase